MGAIYGRTNVVNMVRIAGKPYWRIFQSEEKRKAYNYVCSADFDNKDMGIEDSCNALMSALNSLSAGRYILIAYPKPGETKNLVDTWIELEPVGQGVQVAGIGSTGPAKFMVAGIGEITPENFEQVVEGQFDKLLAKQREKAEFERLRRENAELKKKVEESESGFEGGLKAIGAVLWPMVKDTEAGQFINKTIAGFKTYATKQERQGSQQHAGDQPAVGSTTTEEGDAISNEMQEALIGLLGDKAEDPQAQRELANELKLLAKVKQSDPGSYQDAIEYAKNL